MGQDQQQCVVLSEDLEVIVFLVVPLTMKGAK